MKSVKENATKMNNVRKNKEKFGINTLNNEENSDQPRKQKHYYRTKAIFGQSKMMRCIKTIITQYP